MIPRKLVFVFLMLLFIGGSLATAHSLHFTNGSVTVVPTTVGQYYDEIAESNLSWAYAIGPIVPKPLVDTFGGGEFGWQIIWFWVIGAIFVIMFGRQRNVVLPGLALLASSWFFISGGLGYSTSTGVVIPNELITYVYGFACITFAGIFYYMSRRKR